MKLNQLAFGASLTLVMSILTACGGGGGGVGGGTYSSVDVVRYPYETVYGDACQTSEPTPGCTFSAATGQRISVSADPTYNSQGYGSDDLWYVKFNSSGSAAVYNDLGQYQYTASANQFAGYIGGTTIGVGTTGAFWENVSNKTYWFGKNGVLYSANTGASNYGKAINNKDASKVSDSDLKALRSEANVKLIKAGADKLMKQYGLSASKATAVASALNTMAVMGVQRGKVTEAELDKTFRTFSGSSMQQAIAAVKAFQAGDVSQARELTNRSADALGLKPEQAQAFIKGMYKGALSKFGYDVDQIKW